MEPKTFTEQELFEAMWKVTQKIIEAAHELYMDVEGPEIKQRTKPLNDTLVELGLPHNAMYKYLLNKEDE